MSTSEKPLHIDIPVTLPELKVAFSVAALGFEGDTGLHLSSSAHRERRRRLEGQGPNHSGVSYQRGPRDVARLGVQHRPHGVDWQSVQATCGRTDETRSAGRALRATAAVHHWGNEDLLPGIKVNTDAMSRMSQLVQEGFVQNTVWD
jgi:hypothetical protein